MAFAALALRLSPAQPPRHVRRLLPAVGEPDAATLDRQALNLQQVALIASLWPEARPCVVPVLHLQLPAPALLSAPFDVSWLAPQPLGAPSTLPCPESASQIARAA